jgi:hypothetical protein
MKHSIFTFLFLSVFWAHNAGAQDCSELSPSNSGSSLLSGLLGGDDQSIDGACQLATGEDYYAARIEYNGYDDKEYKLIGQLLGANRRKVPGCDPVAISLKGRPTSADLNFKFEARTKDLAVPDIAVRYLKVSIVASDDPLSDLDIGGLSLTGTSAEYRIDHKFRTGTASEGNPSSNVTVSVSFTPVGLAKKIKQ